MRHTPVLCIAIAAGLAHANSVCVSPNAPIPDNSVTGIEIPIEIDAGANERIEILSVSLDIEHPWVGDLIVTLRSPSGTEVTLLDRPGIPSSGFPGPFGCGGRNLDATFTDSASVLAEDICSYSAQPVIVGDVVPSQPLQTFMGEPASGAWTLIVSDRSAYDAGVLVEACIQATTTIACTPDLTGDGVLDFFDVSAFLSAYSAQDPAADFTGDGQFDFFDVSAFLNAFSAGCP
ncbi:MAG: GC-type dockerin domain-anchored protein [Phycisphaerales bacterium]